MAILSRQCDVNIHNILKVQLLHLTCQFWDLRCAPHNYSLLFYMLVHLIIQSQVCSVLFNQYRCNKMPKGSVVNFVYTIRSDFVCYRMGFLWNSKLWKYRMCTKKLCLYFSSIACGESLIGKASYSARAVFVLNFPLKGNLCGFMGRIAPMAKITVLYKRRHTVLSLHDIIKRKQNVEYEGDIKS